MRPLSFPRGFPGRREVPRPSGTPARGRDRAGPAVVSTTEPRAPADVPECRVPVHDQRRGGLPGPRRRPSVPRDQPRRLSHQVSAGP